MRRSRQEASGGILGRAEILKRLLAGQIFAPGTWAEGQLKNAAYEVRIANDLMFIPGPDGKHVKYGVGQQHIEAIILKEGEVALVSTAERFRLPEDVAAYVGTKWSLARRGLLVLTGDFVNPRFGLHLVGDDWEPADDERLHFLIVNLGSEPQALKPRSDSVVSLQFHKVLGDPGLIETGSTQRLISENYEASAPASALSLFPELNRQHEEIKELKEEIKGLKVEVERVENGFGPLVTFGVYLLAITFLGVILNSSIQLASDKRVVNLANEIPHGWAFAFIVIMGMICGTVVIKALIDALVKLTTGSASLFARLRREYRSGRDSG